MLRAFSGTVLPFGSLITKGILNTHTGNLCICLHVYTGKKVTLRDKLNVVRGKIKASCTATGKTLNEIYTPRKRKGRDGEGTISLESYTVRRD